MMTENQDNLYDRVMTSVPDFEMLSTALIEEIEEFGSAVNVLEVGSGTGLLSTRLVESRAVARLTCVDPDTGASRILRQRLRTYPQDIDIREAPLQAMSSSRPYDVVVGRFSLHHVPDSDKASFLLYQGKLLRTGGLLLVGDMVLPHYHDNFARRASVWDYYKKTISYARNLGVSELLKDQYSCLRADLKRDDEYKICRCRMLELIEEAGFDILKVRKIRETDPSKPSHFWPGLTVVTATIR